MAVGAGFDFDQQPRLSLLHATTGCACDTSPLILHMVGGLDFVVHGHMHNVGCGHNAQRRAIGPLTLLCGHSHGLCFRPVRVRVKYGVALKRGHFRSSCASTSEGEGGGEGGISVNKKAEDFWSKE